MALSPSTKKYVRNKPTPRLVAPRRILASHTGFDSSPRIPFWAGVVGVGIVLLLLVGIILGWSILHPPVHIHANFLMVISGNQKDFSLSEFQSPVFCGPTINDSREEANVHLHNNNGGVIHVHAENVTYGDFFAAHELGMELSEHCFADENGSRWCDQANGNRWQYFLNGEPVSDLSLMVVNDLDQALLLYGYYTPKQLDYWMKKMPTDACQFSGKCAITDSFVDAECGT